jgi:hypothetical protein
MKARCYIPHNKDYKNYGARNIGICDEWLNPEKSGTSNCSKGFIAFKNWALSNGYADDLTLDRIDVNKDYSPSNCRWVSRRVQQNNTRRNCYITYRGTIRTLAQWCELLGLNYRKTVVRIRQLGWSIERAFNTI